LKRERRPRLIAITCVWTLALLALAWSFAAAQGPPVFTPSANPVSDAVRTLLAREAKNLVASAELMPADKYAFRPTPAQITFGQLIAHIVQTNIFICSGIGSAPSPMTPEALKELSGTDAKDALVAAIKKSFDYCSESLARVQDSTLGEEVSMFGRKAGQSRAAAMITIATDWTDHYSTAASYLRLNGILPPTAQPKK
jgi:DinB superfamily